MTLLLYDEECFVTLKLLNENNYDADMQLINNKKPNRLEKSRFLSNVKR